MSRHSMIVPLSSAGAFGLHPIAEIMLMDTVYKHYTPADTHERWWKYLYLDSVIVKTVKQFSIICVNTMNNIQPFHPRNMEPTSCMCLCFS